MVGACGVRIMQRQYSFPLPVTVPAFAINYAVDRLQSAAVWHDIPSALKKKIADAQRSSSSLLITRADLDSLSDHAWSIVEHMIPQ